MSVFPVMESLEGRTSSPVSADVRLMMSHSARTADGHTDDPTGASSQTEAFPAAEESSPTEKQKKGKKRIRALFRGIGKAMCRVFCRGEDDTVSPFPCSDPMDVQPDISGIKWALSRHPCPSGNELPINTDAADLELLSVSDVSSLVLSPKSDPEPSIELLSVSDMSRSQLSPVPSFCSLELIPDMKPVDPEPSPVPGPSALDSGIPGPSGSGAAFEKRKKRKGIAALFRRMGKALFTLCCNEDDVKCSDPMDVQPDLSGIKGPGPSEVESEIPGPSGSGAAFDSFADELVSEMPVLGPSSRDVELTPDMGLADPEPKPVPGAPDVEPVPGPSSSCSYTGSFPSFYEVKGELGSGGFGIVYEGTRRCNGQKVAIKFIPKISSNKFIELPGSTKPLLAEVAVNLLLRRPPNSPYIVHMLDWFEQPEQYVLIMEYPHPCVTLLEFVKCNGLLDETVARELMSQAVLAAKHCIDQDIFHRDIKTDNILVNTETLQLKLIDFGCSELFQTSKGHECAVRSTVWCLGRVLLEIASGDQPFSVLQSGNLNPLRSSLSNECQDLMKQCLDLNKSLTLEQILEHPWFQQN